jgi:hypothetical protein
MGIRALALIARKAREARRGAKLKRARRLRAGGFERGVELP